MDLHDLNAKVLYARCRDQSRVCVWTSQHLAAFRSLPLAADERASADSLEVFGRRCYEHRCKPLFATYALFQTKAEEASVLRDVNSASLVKGTYL